MQRLPDLEAWAMFAKVVETGSFSRAAADLGTSKATVSKAVTRLEARLGASLFHRTSRRIALTELGRISAEKAARILAEGEAAEAEAGEQSTRPRGIVRLAAPMSFGIAHVAPILPTFIQKFPEVSVDLHLGDELVDLVGGGFDLALRIADLRDSSLRSQRLCRVRRLLVAAPTYLKRAGLPHHPRDLASHACLGYTYLPSPDRWSFIHSSGKQAVVVPTGPLRANNADALAPALRAGLGLAIQPEFMIWEDIRRGRLEAILPDWSLPEIALNLVTPPSSLRPKRVSVLIEFLMQTLSSAPWVGLES